MAADESQSRGKGRKRAFSWHGERALFHSTHDLDRDGSPLRCVPHLDHSPKGPFAELRHHRVAPVVELIADVQHVVVLGSFLGGLGVVR